jgi:signal transduction histidine kinase
MRFYFCVLLQLLMPPAASQDPAKPPKYALRHYTSDNGLPQNSVMAITQDRDGFIWLTTNMGLSRFDGQSFVTFDKEQLGLELSGFLSFTRDIEGRTQRLYALADGGKKHIRIANGRATHDKNVLENHVLKMFKPNDKPYELMYTMGLPDRFHKDMTPRYCLYLLPNSNGDFYIWTYGGKVELYNHWKLQKSFNTRLSSPVGLFRVGKNLYYDDEAGSIRLVATADAIATGTGIILTPAPGESEKPDLSKAYTVYADDFSGDAFIYQEQKLYKLSERSPGHFATTVLLSNFDFGSNSVSSVFYDSRQQRLYLGTLSNGLFIFDFEAFESLATTGTDPGTSVYYATAAFSDSTVITPSFHVLGKGKKDQIIADILPGPVEEAKKPMERHTMLRARSGDIWMVRYRWLYHLDGSGQKFKGRWNLDSDISILYEGDDGRIWLGMETEGLKYVDPEEKGVPIHTFTPKIFRVTYMLQETKDVLWVATYWGLFKVNLARNTISRIINNPKFYIRSMWLDRPGELWFTTYDNGFFLLKNGKLIRLPLDRDRFLAHAHCIVRDDKGFFWIPTNQGLFRILQSDMLDFATRRDSTGLYYHRYNKQSGFRNNEFNGGCQPCGVRLPNGYVSLPSMDGLVFFKPEQVPVDVPDSKIFIDRVEADSRRVPVNGSKIELADVNDIQVFVSSPYLGDRQNQQLYYTVSSDDRASTRHVWYPIENEQQSIHLNNLGSGTYTLKIRKNGGFGRNSQRLTTLTIVIPYAWYETWPFKVFVVIMALVAIYLYFKNRLRKADGLNKVLESRVSERTRNLQDTLGVLKNSEQELLRQTRLQMHLIASISHDIRSPLKSIEFASGKLSGLIQEGEYTLAETVGTSVNDSSRRILTLLENMLSYVRSQFSDSSVVYETFAARGLVDEVAFIFKQAFVVQGNQFENNVPETLQIKSNRQLLKIILHNLIDNANKFTPEGSVAVRADLNREVTTLVVSDAGAGLPEKILNWFNESDAAYPESPDGEPGIHGIGLVIVKELAEILKVEIKADATSGTQFSITFPERD